MANVKACPELIEGLVLRLLKGPDPSNQFFPPQSTLPVCFKSWWNIGQGVFARDPKP